ncbi:MAG: phosphoenolpyruvate synthase [Bacteroidales bacterium]|nr:phosphoenolpyruvate synthase [Bacteroidales bacterium]
MDNTKDFLQYGISKQSPHLYMEHRIHKILLVCCPYDEYILEEDGHLETQINEEYNSLNMSNPPAFVYANSSKKALELLESGEEKFDFILSMYNVGEPDVFEFATRAKEVANIPFVLIASYSKEIYRRISERNCSAIDYFFCWHGSADLILAIIKLMEDNLNADTDIIKGGVQAILLVEDSVRFYSTYLPELYKIILVQNSGFLKDAYNEQQQIMRKRSRPKVLLATNYSEAMAIYKKYRKNLLGVISDVGMVVNKGDNPETEKLDAGIDLCKEVKEKTPWMPVILQSSQTAYKSVAQTLNAGFIAKTSKSLLSELKSVILREFGFGDFIFRDPATGRGLGRASDLMQMQNLVQSIPDDILSYHLHQMKLSKWLYARGLFPLANVLRSLNDGDFPSLKEHREAIVRLINDYRIMLGQGIVAQFDETSYSNTIGFARLGNGSIGGKARGLSFMNYMLAREGQYYKYPNVRVMIPRSLVIATDYFDDFINLNGLNYIISNDSSDETVLSEFLNSTLPIELQDKLRVFVKTCNKPLAVRSSSKLEDSHFQPFAGVYATYMIPRCEDDDQMYRLLARAVKSVYASVYFATSKAYIQSTQNVLSEEKMAVLIQEVCGSEQNGYYFPSIAGVARSRNFYPLGYELSEDGVCNIVMGLGKAVVDGEKSLRFCPKYPDKALQTSTPELAARDAQTEVMALDLKPENFKPSTDDAVNIVRIPVHELEKYRNSRYACSYFDLQSGRISESKPFGGGNCFPVITFNKVLKYNTFPLAQIVSDLLELGEREMSCPVEIEFAVNMDVPEGEVPVFYLLQIRPIYQSGENVKLNWDTMDKENPLCLCNNALGSGITQNIKDIIYVKFDRFSPLETQKIADELKEINRRMKEEKREYILIGTGRWGTTNPTLGVPVRWEHISEARVIIESAIENFNVESSQGTHFFQNVTSLGVGYMSLNPLAGDGSLAIERLNSMPATFDGEYLRVVTFDHPLFIYIDSDTRKGIIKD